MLKVLDLFSGIGGFSLGLERAEMKTVAFCENDPDCRKVLEKHWPFVLQFDDIKKIGVEEIAGIRLLRKKGGHGNEVCFQNIDVICGGFPCTDISIAGKGKGFSDESEILSNIEREFTELLDNKRQSGSDFQGNLLELCSRVDETGRKIKAGTTRSGLWKEFFRVIKEVGPRYVIIENVANLRSKGLNQIIQDLWKIGYDAEWHIISASSIGAPHLRERIFIIAIPSSERDQSAAPIIAGTGSSSDPYSNGLQLQPGRGPGKDGEEKILTSNNGKEGRAQTSDADNFRLWNPFASQEAQSDWWTETSSRFGHWQKIKPPVCGVDDGVPRGLDKARRERIKQLGNSVLPQIPELIGREIIEYENQKTP